MHKTKRGKHVVIVGGGFGGFYTARYLIWRGFTVTLISERDYFTFISLLVEVATGILDPRDITIPFATFFYTKRFSFVHGVASHINITQQRVYVGDRSYAYDYLVIATGARSRDFNIPGAEYALHLKTYQDALTLKKVIIDRWRAEQDTFTVNVIGGGATGVEYMLGVVRLLRELGEQKPGQRYCLRLLDSGDEILRGFTTSTREYTRERLRNAHIHVHTGIQVKRVTPSRVICADRSYESDVTLMSIGVIPRSDLFSMITRDEYGNVPVDEHLRVVGLPSNVFALGDMIRLPGGVPPKLAQLAVAQARRVASNILRTDHHLPLRRYQPRLKGSLIALGCWQGTGNVKTFPLFGWWGYMLRALFYIYAIPGFRYKIRLGKSWTAHALKFRHYRT